MAQSLVDLLPAFRILAFIIGEAAESNAPFCKPFKQSKRIVVTHAITDVYAMLHQRRSERAFEQSDRKSNLRCAFGNHRQSCEKGFWIGPTKLCDFRGIK